jgi:hypothetical protein
MLRVQTSKQSFAYRYKAAQLARRDSSNVRFAL